MNPDPRGKPDDHPRHSWIDPRLTAGPSVIAGRGILAARPIKAGETVMIWGGVKVSKRDWREQDFHAQSATPFDDDTYLARPIGDRHESIDDYLNHSCDPSAWLAGAVTVVARRDIRAGEEVTVDCATWDADETWPYLEEGGPCRCGSRLCRKDLTPRDWTRPELQARYAGHFSPYIEKKIRESAAVKPSSERS